MEDLFAPPRTVASMNLKNIFYLIIFLGLFLPLSGFAQADYSFSGDYKKKSEQKNSSRWTLTDWLAQKERNKMMDLWLQMYAPSPYEFFLSGEYLSYQSSPGTGTASDQTYTSYKTSLAAYALIMGLQFDYENNWKQNFNNLDGSLNIRIMGNAIQATHLSLFYGLRTQHLSAAGQTHRLNENFYGAEFDLYLNRLFGLHTLYKSFPPTTDQNFGELSSTRHELGLFIDFDFLRIFGTTFTESQKTNLNAIETTIEQKGFNTGVKFFF